jgi:hypothetical protein
VAPERVKPSSPERRSRHPARPMRLPGGASSAASSVPDALGDGARAECRLAVVEVAVVERWPIVSARLTYAGQTPMPG